MHLYGGNIGVYERSLRCHRYSVPGVRGGTH
jgi:hypothetical protein